MSVVNAKEFVFIWEIPNFSFEFYKTGDALDSPVFEVGIFGGSHWNLRLYPRGEKASDFVSCYLYKKKNDIYSEECSLTYELEFFGDGKSLGKEKSENCKYKLNERHGCERSIRIITVCYGLKAWPGNILTVKCHLFKTKIQINDSDFKVRTEVPVYRTLFLWSIKISSISSQPLSKDIIFDEKPLHEITLSIHDDTVTISITQKEELEPPMLLVCKVSLVNSKCDELKSKSARHLFKKNDNTDVWKFPTFISSQDLDIKSDIFYLLCEIVGSNGIITVTYTGSEDDAAKTESNFTVMQDLRKMLHNHIHSDIKIKCGSELLHAHKSILAARSPVFSAMFDQDMIESKTGIVDISDFEPDVLKLFLEFLYTDSIIKFDYEKTKKLFVVADKYQVSLLLEKCATFLKSILSLVNAVEILSIADSIGHKPLKAFAMNFTAANSEIIFNTSDWQDLIRENIKLAGEMFAFIASNFKMVSNK